MHKQKGRLNYIKLYIVRGYEKLSDTFALFSLDTTDFVIFLPIYHMIDI